MTKYKKNKIQIAKTQMQQNINTTKYKWNKIPMQQYTNGTKYKQNKMQKYQNTNMPKYKRNSILGVPIENQCVKGGGLLYGGS